MESYREVARRKEAFKADLTQYKGKQLEAVQRAVDSGVLNNTYRSHELVNLLSKIEADKGIVFDYSNNAKIKESGFAVEGKNVTAYKNGNKVTLNIQSSKAWQSAVGHEITHVLEGTDAYAELQHALYSYAERKGEYKSRRAKITELYKGMNADVDSELTADLVGEYLFSDEDFVKHLTTNRNLFQRIYDEIKYLYKVATGKEQKEIARVKRMFDKAWKELNVKPAESGQKNNTAENSGAKYSIKNTSELTLKEQLNLFYNSKLKSSDALYFGTTPSALEKAGLSNLPLAFGQKDFKKSTNIKHNTPRRVIKKLNVSVSEPILSFAHGNRIGVLTSDVDADGKPVLVAIEKNVMMDREPVNAIRSVYGLDNPKEWIKNQIGSGKEFVLYDEKRANSFLQTYGYKASVEEGIKLFDKSLPTTADEKSSASTSETDSGTASKLSISNDNGNVKRSLSPEVDSEYLTAVESGEVETAQKLVDEAAESAMKDSKIRDESGKLRKVYHGSDSADFYEFDKQRRGQTDSSMYGRGYYFAFDSDYASDFGENIREFYVDIKNPYYIDINAPASKIANFLESKGVKVDFDYSNMISHFFAKNFGSQKFADTLVDLGYDGVIVRTDEGDYFEAVAFHQNQMKLADAVTYDNDGNVIPLSERFNKVKTDVRYSVSDKTDDIVPVRSFGTPLNELYYDDIAPVRKDITSAKATALGENKTTPQLDDIAPVLVKPTKAKATLSDDDIAPTVANNAITAPIRDDLAPVKDGVNSKVFISMEEFANNDASLWNNVEYNDQAIKSKIMRETHNAMIAEGAVIKISDDTLKKVAESFPDLRTMKKKDRTQLLKDSMNKLKNNLRTFLSKFKGHSFEFEVNGKVLEARLYNTGINEVLEKVTQEKSSMLYSTEKIFQNSRYMYSTIDYDGDPNVYRWNYFYTPVQIGEGTVGVRIAVRDLAKQGESQIYHWGIKKDTSLDGVRDDSNNRKSYDVSSDVSNNIIPKDNEGVKKNATTDAPSRDDVAPVLVKPTKAKATLSDDDIAPVRNMSNTKLTEADIDAYVKVGERAHVRNEKESLIRRGVSPILCSDGEIKDFISESLGGESRDVIKAYGRVGGRLANDIYEASYHKTDVDGYYLELDSNRIEHMKDHMKKEAEDY